VMSFVVPKVSTFPESSYSEMLRDAYSYVGERLVSRFALCVSRLECQTVLVIV
jgi:hypothetical protein